MENPCELRDQYVTEMPHGHTQWMGFTYEVLF